MKNENENFKLFIYAFSEQKFYITRKPNLHNKKLDFGSIIFMDNSCKGSLYWIVYIHIYTSLIYFFFLFFFHLLHIEDLQLFLDDTNVLGDGTNLYDV